MENFSDDRSAGHWILFLILALSYIIAQSAKVGSGTYYINNINPHCQQIIGLFGGQAAKSNPILVFFSEISMIPKVMDSI